jgi:type I restriction enzyme, S subunit
VRLGELGTWSGGGTPSKRVASYWNGDIPWVSPKDMKVARIRDTIDHISSEAVGESATSLVPAGSVLVVTRSGILKHTLPVAIAEREVALNQDLKALAAAEGVDPVYVAWFLRSAAQSILRECSKAGTTVSNIDTRRLLDFELPLPPLNEQRRIVAAIDEHLSRLDAADASLTVALHRSEGLERVVLNVCLFADGAPLQPVSNLAVLVTDGDHNPPKRVASGVPHLTARNVKRGTLTVEGATFVSPEGFEQTRKRYEPLEGDVIVTCVGTIGQTAVVPRGLVFSADRNLAAIRPSDGVDSHFLRLALAAPRSQDVMASASSSTAQPHLYLRDLRSVQVPLPPLEEQRRIVLEVEARLSSIEGLRASIERAQRRSKALRAAVLAKAFCGELVPQDPSDEPAEALLARIRAERGR